eukprot:COSAG02_NODE_11937_length_1628_cov_14.278613_1_plen_157_part_00
MPRHWFQQCESICPLLGHWCGGCYHFQVLAPRLLCCQRVDNICMFQLNGQRQHRVSGIQYPLSIFSIQYPVSSVQCPVSSIRLVTSFHRSAFFFLFFTRQLRVCSRFRKLRFPHPSRAPSDGAPPRATAAPSSASPGSAANLDAERVLKTRTCIPQ